MNWLYRTLRGYSVKDLILIAAMAALGLAVKAVVTPLIHLASASLFIPGGALGGGIYMMWLVMAAGITGKRGAATLAGVVQAILVILTGVGSHGLLSLLSYTLPGIAIDIWLLISRHRLCCLPCAFVSCILANLSGTVAVNLFFFKLPILPMLLSFAAAAFSGGVGGVLAWHLLVALRKFDIIA